MQIAGTILKTRENIFAWRCQADWPVKVSLALGFAIVTGFLAQVRVPLSFTPVPVTGQTLAALLAGVLLGKRWSGVSMAIYGIAGLAGIPWFNGGTAGFGATTGYILGFVLAASFIGYLTDKYLRARNFISLFSIMIFSSIILVYVPGLIWLGAWLNVVMQKPVNAGMVLNMGALPFIAGDILKAAIVAGIAWLVLPKTSFSRVKDNKKANS